MDLLGLMRTFVRVSELGGFSAAARDLNLGQPAVSKQVVELEERLGARLLHRSASGVAPTEDGVAFLEEARRALAAAEAAVASVGARKGIVRGMVRLGAPVAFGRLHVVPRLPALMERHPELSVDLVLGDGFADLVTGALDLSLRIGELTDPDLVARRIGVTRRAVVASPGYLARRGTPSHPRDLAAHDCVLFTGLATGAEWPFAGPDGPFRARVSGRFRANSSEAVREAVIGGLGIGLCPTWLLGAELREGRVVTLLPDWTATPLPVHAVTASRHGQASRVRAVLDFLASEFRLDPLLSDYGAGVTGVIP